MIKWHKYLDYSDDFIIVSKNVDRQVEQTDETLACLETAGVTRTVKTCKVFIAIIAEYTGHIISPEEPEDDRTNQRLYRQSNLTTFNWSREVF